MEYADGDKCKIVYSSPEAMVEFSEGQEGQTNRVFLKRGLQPHRDSCFF